MGQLGFFDRGPGETGGGSLMSRKAKPSTQYADGALLIMSAGYPILAASQTAAGFGVFANLNVPKELREPATRNLSSAAYGEPLLYHPVGHGISRRFASVMGGNSVPLLLNKAVISGTSTTVVTADIAATTSNDDWNGGLLLCNGQERTIVDSATSGGNITFTVDEPFDIIPTTAHKITAVFVNVGFKPKLNGTTPHLGISQTKADSNNGTTLIITDIHLEQNATGWVEVVFL